jgi:hypothetical protein
LESLRPYESMIWKAKWSWNVKDREIGRREIGRSAETKSHLSYASMVKKLA